MQILLTCAIPGLEDLPQDACLFILIAVILLLITIMVVIW